ncbi:MAG: ACP S-malonyltransferase [Holosporaceae bacterium]|jgi:[acyl-carrier-protein] S-malonyltransferase|nr:ACP S-malonyltransferase [Holosporaceae bacterium]
MLLMFPGQGSQAAGMGMDVYDAFPSARDVFHSVDDALSQKLSHLIFHGDEGELKKTSNAQPALMAVSMALATVLRDEFGVDVGKIATFFAGHSLGEYSALCAAGVISIPEAAKVLRIRGRAMAEACPSGGSMAAIVGLTSEDVENILPECCGDGQIVQLANDNSPLQVVVSGHREAVEKVMEKSLKSNAKMAKMLEVSGPFHSILMEEAVAPVAEALEEMNFRNPVRPVIANVTARAEIGNFRELLLKQLTERVRWRESMAFAAAHSISACVEIGAGRVLSGLAKKISSDWDVTTVNSLETLEKFAKTCC